MRKNQTKHFVYLQYLTNEKGFNFVTLLSMITIIFLTLPFLSYTLQLVKPTDSYQELAVHEFFRYIRDDIIQSQNVYVIDNALYLIEEQNNTAVIKQYHNLVQRQVKGRGHEVYLSNVEDLRFIQQPLGIQVLITFSEGETYERLFPVYHEV